ncbi:MAG: hypothetical protein GY801_35780 [bacterium]|nr:hypothetical protein [bacterium]
MTEAEPSRENLALENAELRRQMAELQRRSVPAVCDSRHHGMETRRRRNPRVE